VGSGVAWLRGGPGAAVGVVLERVVVSELGARVARDLRPLARRAGMVRGQLSTLLRDPVAAPAGGENDRARVDHMLAAGRAPAVLAALEPGQRRLRERLHRGVLDPVAQRLRDRVPGAVADLEQPLPRGPAAAREPVAA